MSDAFTSKDVAEHELKIASQFFDVVESGQKPFEIRKGDRPFKIGDILWLREVNIVLAYTGREMRKRITFCLRGWGMEDGYVALGLAPLHSETTAPHSEVSADVSELRRLAGHYGGYAEKIMCKAATEIEQRRAEVEKYKAWAASCDPCFEYPPDAEPAPDAKPDAWMSSINPDLVTSDENEVLCWNNPPVPLYRRAVKSGDDSNG